MPTYVSRYAATITIELPPPLQPIIMPVRKVHIEYRLNEIPKASVLVPYGFALNAFGSVIPWATLASTISRLARCSITITSINQSLTNSWGNFVNVFVGYVIAVNLHVSADGAYVEIQAAGRLIELGFGSVLSGIMHASSPSDFSLRGLPFGVPTIQQLLSNNVPHAWIWSTVYPPQMLAVDLLGWIRQVMALLLSTPIVDTYAATRIQASTGFSPFLVLPGRVLTFVALGSLLGSLIPSMLFRQYAGIIGPAYAETVALATIGADAASWTSSTALARLKDLGATFGFIIAPTSGLSSTGVVFPDNPNSIFYTVTANPDHYIQLKSQLTSKFDLRGIILVGDAKMPAFGELLGNTVTIAGFYDSGWNFGTTAQNLLGALLAVPAPHWLKATYLSDWYAEAVDRWMQYNSLTANKAQNDVIVSQYLTVVNTLYVRALSSLGCAVAAALYHSLAFEPKKLVLSMPLAVAMSQNFIPGPGTVMRVFTTIPSQPATTEGIAYVGRVETMEIILDFSEKTAVANFYLTHVKTLQEIVSLALTGVLPLFSHPLWLEPQYINPIGVL